LRFSLRFHKYWLGYFLIKLLYMFLALFVYSRFTQLGDTVRYISGPTFSSGNWLLSSTHMMDTLAYSASLFLGKVLANFPFMVLSFIGIYYAVKRIDLTNKQLLTLLALLSLPSFSIWTSIASKEAMAVFYLGIILGFIVDLIKSNPKKNFLLVSFAFYLCALFKPQYLIGISAILSYIFFSKKLSLKGVGKAILLVLFFVFSFSALYFFRSEINELSYMMPIHFNLDSGSTRENTIWVNYLDVFWNAPYGMYIAFVGPTMAEAFSKTTWLLVWLESMFILVVFFIALLKLLMITYKTGRLNIYYVGLFLTVTLWILFVHYPFGSLNAGSAIRYRSGFFGFLVILFYFLYVESLKRYRGDLQPSKILSNLKLQKTDERALRRYKIEP
jgi:hypothetical protein